ncbi:hypothetical protein T06_5814 [Trichinella sp. T6]|nr:hypothetical protein T06_5814 [Trichinella sp. T6]
MAFAWRSSRLVVWSTTGGPFTVSRVSENNSAYSSIMSCTEVGATICTPTSRLHNGLNQFLQADYSAVS